MRKTFTLLLAGAALIGASGAVMASDVRFSVSIGVPSPYVIASPVVVAPAPVYYPPRVVYAPAYPYYYAPPRAIYAPRVAVIAAPRGFRHPVRYREHGRRW